jgi:hypothetical protein
MRVSQICGFRYGTVWYESVKTCLPEVFRSKVASINVVRLLQDAVGRMAVIRSI